MTLRDRAQLLLGLCTLRECTEARFAPFVVTYFGVVALQLLQFACPAIVQRVCAARCRAACDGHRNERLCGARCCGRERRHIVVVVVVVGVASCRCRLCRRCCCVLNGHTDCQLRFRRTVVFVASGGRLARRRNRARFGNQLQRVGDQSAPRKSRPGNQLLTICWLSARAIGATKRRFCSPMRSLQKDCYKNPEFCLTHRELWLLHTMQRRSTT